MRMGRRPSNRPRAQIKRVVLINFPVPLYDRLQRLRAQHGVSRVNFTLHAIESYVTYVENGQWAVTVGIDLIEPIQRAARKYKTTPQKLIEHVLQEYLAKVLTP